MCGESDPLTFTGWDSRRGVCRWCGGDLGAAGTDAVTKTYTESDIQAVEDAYRTALAGAEPVLLPNATAVEFRSFVEDMFHLLTRSVNGAVGHPSSVGEFSRQDILAMIAALVLNAAPAPNETVRGRRRARGFRLWGTVLSVIPEYERATIERSSIRWPVALRRRFFSGLYYNTQKRWPYAPFREATHSGRPVERAAVASVFGLTGGAKQISDSGDSLLHRKVS